MIPGSNRSNPALFDTDWVIVVRPASAVETPTPEWDAKPGSSTIRSWSIRPGSNPDAPSPKSLSSKVVVRYQLVALDALADR
jgi:hypothetical protein